MRGLLVHTAASLDDLGATGPIFDDGSFEYVPLPGVCPPDVARCRTYADIPAKNRAYGKTLADFLPEGAATTPVHLDPDFEHCIYGDVYAAYGIEEGGDVREVCFRGPSRVRELEVGDALFFMAELRPHGGALHSVEKYVIGFFSVEGVADVSLIKVPRDPGPVRALLAFADPPLAPREDVVDEDLDRLVEWGYVKETRDLYRLTWEGATVLLYASVLLSEEGSTARWFASYLKGRAERVEGLRVLSQGGSFVIAEVRNLSGSVERGDIENSAHYEQLFPIDINPNIVIVKGAPEKSALLERAVPLTRGRVRRKFKLNELGRKLLGRDTDRLRESFWLGMSAVRNLVREVREANPGIVTKLMRCNRE